MNKNRFRLLVAAAILDMILFLGLGIFIGYRIASNSYRQQIEEAQHNSDYYRWANYELLEKAYPDSLERLNAAIDMEMNRKSE